MKISNPLKALVLALLVAVSCNNGSPIPKKTLQKIYYDLLLVDSRIELFPELKTQSDSMSVYPAIFAKYGYTTEDFLRAQEYWVTRPEALRKMIEANKALFDKRAAVLGREMEVRDSIADAALALHQDSLAQIQNFLDSVSFACMLDTLCVSFSADTFAVSIIESAVDTAAADTVTVGSKVPSARFDALDANGEDEYRVEEDSEFKELEMLEKASQKHQSSIRKNKERKKKLKDIEEKFK